MPPKNPPGVREVHNAIDSATPDRLRTLLKDLLPKNMAYIQSALMLQPGALKRAWSADEEEDDDDTPEDSGQDYESDYSDAKAGAQPSRQRFEICSQCNTEYDALHNYKMSCEWHDANLDVDWESEIWADHDERCHGPIDTPENRKNCPEGFIWECCDEPGDAAGCKTSRHRPNRAKRVRR